MSIYTKTGDAGKTSLFDGQRVKKYAIRVDTYGIFDECNAQISLSEKLCKVTSLKSKLVWMQEKFFLFNAEVATAVDYTKLNDKSTLIQVTDIRQLESWIDQYQQALPKLNSFILPGRSLAGAQLHVARTVCRRGERRLIELAEQENLRPELKQFVNRLSDCLYVFARVEDDWYKTQRIIEEVIARYQKYRQLQVKEKTIFEQTQQALQAGVSVAETLQVPVSLCLTDPSGRVLASYQMENALLVSYEIAQKKAYSAVAMKNETRQLQELVQPGKVLYQLETITDGQIVTFAGGIPYLDSRGVLISGVGVSGGTVEEDQMIAEAVINKLKEIDDARAND